MRTTADLIAELQEAAAAAHRAALVVAFEEHSDFVWSYNPHALNALNQLVKRGGEPVGIISVTAGGRTTACPLKEFADEEWAEKYLLTLLADAARSVRREGTR